MLKWCPKPLVQGREPEGAADGAQADFKSGLEPMADGQESVPVDGAVFEKDHRLTENTSLWNLMNDREKQSLLATAASDLQEEFESRETELRENHRLELARVHEEVEVRLENWSREFSSGLARDRRDMAVDAAALAVSLARKIIRDTVAVDDDVVVRTLETALFKAQDSHPLTAVLNPEDAEYLTRNPELMARLRIDKIVPDRRMEKGGCCVRAGSREWDATLTRQIDTLAAIVEETVAADEIELVPGGGENNDPGLE